MKPKRIALTGGIATGKSTVAKLFMDLGAVLIDADQAAREVVQPGSSCLEALHRILGPECFYEDGQINRRKVREGIIQDAALRAKVNAVLHPAISRVMEAQWQESLRMNPNRSVIFDIPLLFEADLARHFDTIILVYAPAEVQIERLMSRDHLSREEARNTLEMQLPIEEKRNLAGIIIDNSGELEKTRKQVLEVWELLQKGAH